MKIMKNITRRGRKYEFVKEYERFMVYRDIETNIKELEQLQKFVNYKETNKSGELNE